MHRTHLLLVSLLVLTPLVPAMAQKELTDAQIGADIADRIYHAGVFKHGNVAVSFQNGVATLTGSVDSLGAKMDAEKAARKIDDVTELVNNIEVRAEDVTPRQILEEARKEVVTYYAYNIFDNIVLEAQGNKLIVSGQVSEPFKKVDIGNFLAHVKGVAEVQNDIEVLPTSIFDDQLRRSIARAIYNDPFFVRYAHMSNPPIHIVVKNGNVTLEGVVNSPVEKAKAESNARFAGTYFSLTNNLRVEGQRPA